MTMPDNESTVTLLKQALFYLRIASRRELPDTAAIDRENALQSLEELVSLLRGGVPFPEAADVDSAVEARAQVLEQENQELRDVIDRLEGVSR
jgi:hypothetical protein